MRERKSFGAGASNIKLNYTGNWWGTTIPTTIAAAIQDLSDNYTANLPLVDFSSYLDGPNGSAVAGNFLLGQLTSTMATLIGGVTYDVLGVLFVPSDKSLVIPAGTTLRFHSNAFLVVDGALTISGTSGSVATLTSGRASPAGGNWRGILGARYRNRCVYRRRIHRMDGSGRRRTVHECGRAKFRDPALCHGRRRHGGGWTSSRIENNTIDNFTKVGDGVNLSSASPSITGNSISRTNRAIYMSGSSSPSVSGNNLTGNNWGVYLFGSGSNSATAGATADDFR